MTHLEAKLRRGESMYKLNWLALAVLLVAFSWGDVGRWLRIAWMYVWVSSPFGGGGGGGF